MRDLRLFSTFLAVATIAFPSHTCLASLDDPIVWLDDGVSLEGVKQLVVHPVSNDTGETFEFDVATEMTATMASELRAAGLTILAPGASQPDSDAVIMKNSLIYYTPGNVGGRWVGMGGGAAVCILRSYLIHPSTSEVIGEIVIVKQVAGGGLFSAGAGESVPRKVAEESAEQLTALLGAEEG